MRVNSQIESLGVPSSKFTPLGTQMLIRYEEKTESDGGILYSTPENTWWADVIRVGPGCSVDIGERVLMQSYRGENVDFSDGSFTIVNEREAMAVA